MNNVDNIETEIKLVTFSVEELEGIIDLPMVKSAFVPDTLGVKELESRYYDTKGRKFAKNGIVFRVRKEPSGFVATVKIEKANSGGLSERMEYNVDLEGAEPAFEGFDKVRFIVDLPALVAKEGGVEELFCVSVKRKQVDLMLSDDTVVEMAIDTGEIVAGDKSMPVAEVEFEIKKGNAAELLSFIANLSQIVPLYAEHRSKYARGAELAGEKTGLETKTKKIALDKTPFFKDAVARNLIERHIGKALNVLTQCAMHGGDMKEFCHETLCIRHNLTFYRVILLDTEYESQLKAIDRMIEELDNKSIVEDIAMSWQDIKKTSTVKVNDLMEKYITDKAEFYGKNICTAIGAGKYCHVLFSIWSWLERQRGQAIQLDGKEYINEQIESIWLEIEAIYGSGQNVDYKAIWYKLSAICVNAFAVKKIVSKKTLNLCSQAKKMLDVIKDDFVMQKTGDVIFVLFRTGASRLVYRDAGVLYGYMLHQVRSGDKKTAKIVAKVSKQLEKAANKNKAIAEGDMDDDTDSGAF